MFNKKRLITALVVATLTFVIAVVTVAGMLLFRSSSNTEAIRGATAVGVPKGPVTTKSIGSAGGSIASPDGRITVDVPPNAVSGPVDFSIQPITNLAHGGLGNAYRLEPSEQKFATPIKVSFNFDTQELKGIIPEALAVAYQDKTGVWQAFKTVNVDQASKTLTVATTHFTDFSLWTVRLSPEKATLRLGQTQSIELIGCYKKLHLRGWLIRLLRGPYCAPFGQDGSWSVDIGTITRVAPGEIVYQAPATRPAKNIATVRFEYKLNGTGETTLKDVRTCEITIVDRGYRATGNQGVAYSGMICDLAKPFAVTGTAPDYIYTYNFSPSSATGGTGNFSAPEYKLGATGGYTVEGAETENPRIVWRTLTTAGIGTPVSRTKNVTYHIDLVPLLTDECNKK
jgi:hypothetical protein